MKEPTLSDCINYMKQQLKGMEKYPKSYEYNIPYYRKTIELLETRGTTNGNCATCVKAVVIDERPHGKWIPCSERLPEEEQKIYLVTIDYGDGLSCVAPRFFWDKKRLWNEAEEYITAWMPIPRPYKQEGEER